MGARYHAAGMNDTLDCSQLAWTATGLVANGWQLTTSNELSIRVLPDTPPVPFPVPGSIQGALRAAGVLPDWTIGQQSRACEWVEHRDWLVSTTLPPEWSDRARNGRTVLVCDGLDGFGDVWVNRCRVGTFRNSFIGHEFDLTAALTNTSGPHQLHLVFTGQPRALGQVGKTSQICEWKPRFNYVWDWTPRLVQLAVSEGLRLEHRVTARLKHVRCRTTCGRLSDGESDVEADVGTILVTAEVPDTAETTNDLRVRLELTHNGRVVAMNEAPASHGEHQLRVSAPARWWPNGFGAQPLYDLSITLLAADGTRLDQQHRRIGFKQVTWEACDKAPAGALPWICVVNGRRIFLQGANWVPLQPNFADVTVEQYQANVATYKRLGCTVLRVWGGAVLGHEEFYTACDEAGILVWQEFPLSSSGPDNTPPFEDTTISGLVEIATSYIERRQHHASLLMWCGGNELQSADNERRTPGCGRPWGTEHPALAALARVVALLDAGRRFVPSSSSGPRFMADAKEFGLGLHHDVHGPWDSTGTPAEWDDYWQRDDALLRSETGVPGAGPMHLITRYAGAQAMPPDATNSLYLHSCSWWLQGDKWTAAGGRSDDLPGFVAWSQQRQADSLAVAVNACQERFPQCGGFIVWMGHDCFPCPINTAVIDAEGVPKPAGERLGELFRAMSKRLA